MSRCLVATLLLFSPILIAQDDFVFQLPVSSVESADFSKMEVQQFSQALSIAVGKKLLPTAIDEGVRALFLARKVARFFIRAERSDKGLKITLTGEKYRQIRRIRFVGIDNDILEEVRGNFGLEEGRGLDVGAVGPLIERIRAALGSRGYFSPAIATQYSAEDAGGESDLEVRVAMGQPTRIDKILVQGGSTEEKKVIEGVLLLKRDQRFTKKAVEDEVNRINQFLRANQYPTSKVGETRLSFNSDRTLVDVILDIQFNEKYQFEFVGNSVFEDLELRELLNEEILSQSDAPGKIAQEIENKYRELGYHFVQVTPQTSKLSPQKLNVVRFVIEEGVKVRIDRIHFTGSTSTMSEETMTQLFFTYAPSPISRKIYSAEGMQESTAALKKQLEKLGYIHVTITGPRAVFSEDRKGVDLFFSVELGTQSRVASVEFEGAKAISAMDLESQLGLRPGDPLSLEALTAGKEKLLQYYQEKGYLDAKLIDNPQGDASYSKDLKEVTIRLRVEEGPQYRVGKISVDGNRKTRNEVILREMKVAEGNIYNPKLIRQSEEDIHVLGLFSRVELVANTRDNERIKDIHIHVRETPPGVGEVGFGGFYEDPRFRLRTFLGIAYRNLWGLNQTASARTEVSLPLSRDGNLIPFVEYAGVLGYRAPYFLDLPFTFSTQLVFDSFESRRVGTDSELQTRTRIDGKIERKLSSAVTGFFRFYRLERSVSEILYKPETKKIDIIGSTGPGLVLDLRDDIYNPSKGSYHLLELELASPLLLSQDNISFVMLLSRNSFYFTLFQSLGLNVFAGLGGAQTLFPGRPLPKVRVTNDLSLGGIGSIRGYSPRRFSPILTSTAGGTTTETLPERAAFYNMRAELVLGIMSNFSTAVFFDTGQVYSDLSGYDRHDGVGIGFRYKTPVGPVVVDLAQGLGGEKEAIKFYFTAGTI